MSLTGVPMAAWLLVIGTALIGLNHRHNALEEAQKKRLHLVHLAPVVMTKFMLSIHCGMHPRTSLIEAFETVREDPVLGASALWLTDSLSAGLSLPGAILNFNLTIDYLPLSAMLQRVHLYEVTGNLLILEQLKADLTKLHDEKQAFLLTKIDRADLASMLPNLLLLVLVMIVFMSPIFLGGIK